MKKIIEDKLQKQLAPKFLEVKNNSHLHHGHAGDDGSGNTHFSIIIESEKLRNQSKINSHRQINKILADEFKKGLHALEIKVL
jgi:BolA protein